MRFQTKRFGLLEVQEQEIIEFPEGIMGFPDLRTFCLVDAGGDALILWLQSLQDGSIAFPVLEPKAFAPDYVVRLSFQELRHLRLSQVSQGLVLSILTIPADIAAMTANLKAPLVIHLKERIGRQVVLQENDLSLKFPMFKALKAHLVTIQSVKKQVRKGEETRAQAPSPVPVPLEGFQASGNILPLGRGDQPGL